MYESEWNYVADVFGWTDTEGAVSAVFFFSYSAGSCYLLLT